LSDLPQIPVFRVDDQATQLALNKIVSAIQSIYKRLTFFEGWSYPVLSTTVSNFGAPYAVAAYRKDILGRVLLKGTLRSSPGIPANSVLFTLPVGYRPKETLTFPSEGGGAFQSVKVDALGNVTNGLVIGAGGAVTLTPYFAAEQ
jgi:hypothetical protein